MRVLTVYAHPNPASFCHALLEQFTRGLTDAGHVTEVVDLYQIRFNPLFGLQDGTFFAHDTVPREVLEAMHPREAILALCRNPLQRFLARRWLRGKDIYDIAHQMARFHPPDVLEQQAKVARADGLAFIAPVYWMGYPAMLKGWIDRVFSYGFAYTLTPEGWNGAVSGRVPRLTLQKALILSTTFFQESDYQTVGSEPGFRAAIGRITDDWGLRYPGVQHVEHAYYFAPHAVDAETRQQYLEHAYGLGRDFESGIGEAAQVVA